MARRALLIINRLSRSGGTDITVAPDLLRGHGLELTVEETRTPADIDHRVRRFAGSGGGDLVVIAGGDGSVNAAADALVETGLPFALLPLGTANDLARTLALPTDLPAACAVAANGSLRRIDVGWVNGKHFLNVASVGLSAEVASRLTRERKRRWGPLAYPRTVIGAWASRGSFGATLVCDGRAHRVRSIQIAVGNGRHYGGGMTVASEAAIDDARLHVYSIPPLPLWRLALLVRDMRHGSHGRHAEVLLTSCREVELRTNRRLAIDTDGELTRETPAWFRVVPSAVAVMVPAAGAPADAAQ